MRSSEFKRKITTKLKAKGLETPDLDASLLIQFVTGWTRTDLVLNANSCFSEDVIEKVEALIQRRIAGEPIDHILGYSEFYGRLFDISKNVLSPRPETEELVGKALSCLEGLTAPRVLDLGTGSGAIIVSILAECPGSQGVSVDLSQAALDVASRNALSHGVSERLEFLCGDWFGPVTGTYDLIVSNPPYITDAAMTGLSAEVRDFDPDLALRGGVDGLDPYKVILQNAEDFLKSDGALLFEIGYDQGEPVSTLMKQAGFRDVTVSKDLAGHDRIVSGAHRDN